MPRRDEIAARMADAILKRLIVRKVVEVKDEAAARAAASSLTSTTFGTIRRFRMASAIRAAISSRRGIPIEPTRRRRGESRNGRQGKRHARADVQRALDSDRPAVRLDERLDEGEPETSAAHGAD